ncbi:DUF1697 domain-containing protein [Geodermatophilus ruber]|uniref:Uncharacterized conserved protein, DUF1697 family n=1 Tax=Geodermatophilus ruber TaxID=504800 RepID=A0A1I4KQ18_9ACTN|nr:DUF1697 domain-containing protein [Geodermatophilus ruber]SFL80741.1 Uncharacterized conserved protein, DUF1697 family [Geodermatophilus ruber]
MTTRYVVLLRGINLGKARQVGMAELREALAARDATGVRTHLRSGNVVLDSPLGEAELVAEVEAAVRERFGFDVPTVVRTGAQIADVVAADPLRAVATDPARYLVTFLPSPPAPERVAALPPADRGEFRVAGRELFLWAPDGVASTPLAAWNWDRLLGVPGTARNWNTVRKLAQLAGSL